MAFFLRRGAPIGARASLRSRRPCRLATGATSINAFTHDRFGTHHFRGLAALLLIVVGAAPAHAESVYKCRDAAGHVAYQDRACTNPAQETRIEIAPAPPPAASPAYGVVAEAHPARRRASVPHAATQRGNEGTVLSYECRAEDGAVFYKHSGCPKSIRVVAGHERDRHSAAGRGANARGSGLRSMAVSARPLARSEVCKRLASAGSIGRAGREYDDTVSTYDRNGGRDPCRHS